MPRIGSHADCDRLLERRRSGAPALRGNVADGSLIKGVETPRLGRKVAVFWALAWVGNLMGAMVTAELVAVAQEYPEPVTALLGEVIDLKLSYWRDGGPAAWFGLVLSGVLANWLVGMAAFFAMMGRTIMAKYIPILLAVTAFVAANFQHSPANMGYFALWMAETGEGPRWATALLWNIIPVGLGNIVGATVLVALPFYYVFRPTLIDPI